MQYTRALVTQKIKDIFSELDRARIQTMLDTYGVNSQEPLRERVQLAMLKLSQGDEERLRKHVEHAKVDHYDIIFLAEEPHLYKAYDNDRERLTDEEIVAFQEKDRQQYLDWLHDTNT